MTRQGSGTKRILNQFMLIVIKLTAPLQNVYFGIFSINDAVLLIIYGTTVDRRRYYMLYIMQPS